MRIRDRLRIIADVTAAAKKTQDAGQDEAEATEAAMADAAMKYGTDFDWAVLVEIVLKIIALLFTPKAAALLLVLCLCSTASAQCENGRCAIPAAPFHIDLPASAPTISSCPNGQCGVSARPVIRSTYAPAAPRWRPLRRVFWRGL